MLIWRRSIPRNCTGISSPKTHPVELLEGASVTVLALEGDETFEADAETEKMLLEAIAQCDRRQTTPMTEVLSELRSRE